MFPFYRKHYDIYENTIFLTGIYFFILKNNATNTINVKFTNGDHNNNDRDDDIDDDEVVMLLIMLITVIKIIMKVVINAGNNDINK